MVEQKNIATDTICALATPPGIAGLAVIRVSGPKAFSICDERFTCSTAIDGTPSHHILYGWWMKDSLPLDSVTISVYREPHSYTGEDVVEIGCHGGAFTTEQILSTLLASHARLAEPGEFTRRAFLNRKLDLTQAEAVADIIHAESRIGAQTAARQLSGGFTKRLTTLRQQLLDVIALLELELDFSDEDVEFVDRSSLLSMVTSIITDVELTAAHAHSAEVLRSGFQVAVVGYPNAGKSSLFNALLGRPRAIVSDSPGTTRDYLSETIYVDGYSVHLIDTAGLRDTEDYVELQGITLTRSLIEQSDLVLVVNDSSLGVSHSEALRHELLTTFSLLPVVVIHNKADLLPDFPLDSRGEGSSVEELHLFCSATSGLGLDSVRAMLAKRVRAATDGLTDVLVNARQAQLLTAIGQVLRSAAASIENGYTPDLFAVDIRAAIRLLGDITGESWNPDVLDSIFSRFCIGK